MKKPVFGSQETVIRTLRNPVPVIFDLTNEAHVVPTDAEGNNGNYTGCGTTVVVYGGSVDETTSWNVSAVPSTGVTGILSGYTYTVSNMTTDTGYVDITVSRIGYDSLTKRFSISKSKNGIAYWINSSAGAIQKSQAGEYTPASITFSAICAVAAGSVSDYAGRFVISETTDGVNWTVEDTSSYDEASKVYTPSSGIKAIKVQLFLAGGTTYKLDEEIIPIVSDGMPGADGADGADGINARAVNLTSDVLAFTYDTAGASPTPSSATIIANALNTQGTVYYEFFKNDVSVKNTTSNTYTYTPQSSYSSMPDKIEVQIREGSSTGAVLARDQITIIGMKAGSHGLSISMSNEAHVVPSDSSGNVTDYSNSGTTIKVYEGSNALTYVTSLINSSFIISSVDVSPIGKITVGTITGTSTTSAIVGNHSNMDVATDLVVLTYNITAKRSDGLTIPLVVTQSISKSKQGSNGVRAASIELYQWAASAPTTFPVGTSTYTWATGNFTDPATLNGWTHVPGTGLPGQTLYGCRQVYSDSLTTSTSNITWSATSCYPLGAYGSNGTRTAILEVYKWSATTPTSFPSGTSTYTWATGTFTAPSTPNGWSVSPTTAVAGQTLWACHVTYTDTDTSATDLVTWNTSTAYAIGAAGTNGTDGTDGVDAPRYLGLYSYANRGAITGMNAGDLVVLYSYIQSQRGIYAYVSGAWIKQTTPTQDQIMRCMVGVLDAVRSGYGVSADYIGTGATSFETLLVRFLFAQNIVLGTAGYIQSSNFATDPTGFPSAGFRLAHSTGVLEAVGAKLDIAEVRGVKWSSPVQLGSGLSISGIVYPALAALNGTDVAFIGDSSSSLKVYRWNGSSWAQVGSGLSISGIGAAALAALNSTHVAFIGDSSSSLKVYRWNGSSWVQVGSGLSISGIGAPALTALNSTDVAFIDGGNDSLRVYRWNGSSWAQVGSGLSISGAGYPALTALNSTDVAFIDSVNDSLRVYRWNGSSWAQVGSGLTISGAGAAALAALNSTDVAFIDNINDSLRVYRWNGSTWAQVGSAGNLALAGGFPALAAMNGTDVAFIDSSNDSLRMYRFGFSLATPYHP